MEKDEKYSIFDFAFNFHKNQLNFQFYENCYLVLMDVHRFYPWVCSWIPLSDLISFYVDVMVFIKDDLIKTDLNTKPTEKHQYLFSSSCHR